MQLIPLKSPLIQQGDDLTKILAKILRRQKNKIGERALVVISSKVVALAEKRLVKLDQVKITPQAQKLPSAKYVKNLAKQSTAFKQLILDEADVFLGGKNVYLTLKDRILIPNSGIDLSNVPSGYAVLWPQNSFLTAQKLRQALQKMFHLKKLGVLIIDSHCQPLRTGVVGIALGWNGFQGIEDQRGKKDLYGKPLAVTQKNTADQLASAASLLMGEAGERIPFVLVKDAPVKFTTKKFNAQSYFFSPEEDLFAGIYNQEFLRKIK